MINIAIPLAFSSNLLLAAFWIYFIFWIVPTLIWMTLCLYWVFNNTELLKEDYFWSIKQSLLKGPYFVWLFREEYINWLKLCLWTISTEILLLLLAALRVFKWVLRIKT
jgi:hypothetical protein